MITQGIIGEAVSVLEQREDWHYVQQWDDYQGWIYQFFLTDYPAEWDPDFEYKGLIDWIYETPDTHSRTIRQISTGARLPSRQHNGVWIQVTLPDQKTGYIRSVIATSQSRDIRKRVVETAEKFLGVSYCWGGKTAFGFDCSGFVQTVFRVNGIELHRDTIQQIEDGERLEGRQEFRPGDLVFFTNGNQVDHVGIACDTDRFIHCSGMVKINSFDREDPEFNSSLTERFLQARRMIQE